jgi:hypothetical protein
MNTALTVAVGASATRARFHCGAGNTSAYGWPSGGSVAYLKNKNGLVIKLRSQTDGLPFNLSANGMNIKPQ